MHARLVSGRLVVRGDFGAEFVGLFEIEELLVRVLSFFFLSLFSSILENPKVQN